MLLRAITSSAVGVLAFAGKHCQMSLCSRAVAAWAGSSEQAQQIVKTRFLISLALGLQALLAHARRTVELETATGRLLSRYCYFCKQQEEDRN